MNRKNDLVNLDKIAKAIEERKINVRSSIRASQKRSIFFMLVVFVLSICIYFSYKVSYNQKVLDSDLIFRLDSAELEGTQTSEEYIIRSAHQNFLTWSYISKSISYKESDSNTFRIIIFIILGILFTFSHLLYTGIVWLIDKFISPFQENPLGIGAACIIILSMHAMEFVLLLKFVGPSVGLMVCQFIGLIVTGFILEGRLFNEKDEESNWYLLPTLSIAIFSIVLIFSINKYDNNIVKTPILQTAFNNNTWIFKFYDPATKSYIDDKLIAVRIDSFHLINNDIVKMKVSLISNEYLRDTNRIYLVSPKGTIESKDLNDFIKPNEQIETSFIINHRSRNYSDTLEFIFINTNDKERNYFRTQRLRVSF